MEKQEHQAYLDLFCKLNDLFSPFYSSNKLNCWQKEIFQNFAFCYWEKYRNGNSNVNVDSVPYYLERIRNVGRVLLCEPIDPAEYDESAIEEELPAQEIEPIFGEQECRQIQEDLAIIELIYMVVGSEFISDDDWTKIVNSFSPDPRSPYHGLMCRVVDWCRANPVIICNNSEEEEDAAKEYRQLLM